MNKIISPIAIDMGAKNTGVYYAHYQQGSTFEQIDKRGQVLIYGNSEDKIENHYTALLSVRTQNRHVRRGYQRKKLAKRLLKIILNKHFQFPADQHTQALSFLMNRRGFSFLDGDFSKQHLNKLPNEVWKILPAEVQKKFSAQKNENIADQLMDFAKDNPEKIQKLLKSIETIKLEKFQTKDKQLKTDLFYFDYIEKIDKACKTVAENKSITDKKLSQTPDWIVNRLNEEINLSFTKDNKKYQTDLTQQITQKNHQQIQKKLPDFEQETKTTKTEKKQNDQSIWKFDFSTFELDKKLDDLNLDIDNEDIKDKDKKAHLHHFCYAIYKINQEIISGARHRSKFFNEIKNDLETFEKDEFLKNKHSPQYLVNFIQAVNHNSKLDIAKIHQLVCHISNFELKPLRTYFNNKDYKNGDELDETRLAKIASRWFMQHWIVNVSKDEKPKVENYKTLKKLWKDHNDKNKIIDFWLKIDQTLTIPPYQAMLNRHPPKCQSLLLNIDYLKEHYPNWKEWLKDLKTSNDDNYKNKLKSLQSGQGCRTNKKGEKIDGRLIDDEKIDARQLQFILDITKKQDRYQLNELWSIYHQWQKSETQNKEKPRTEFKEILQQSKLPDAFKQQLTFDNFQTKDSFAHFLNQYYQTRKKAKDGRYFLIQEKKERWITKGKLLTLCTHKPRQLKYQWKMDLSAVLAIDVDKLEEVINKQEPEEYFKSIKGFKSNCEKAAKAQKEHRGALKSKISYELSNKPKGELAKLAKKCDELKQELIKKIGIDILVDKQRSEINQKIALVFKFAQIYNIVFKDRTGFSKTCPVCSTENALRMQENDQGAIASRLPALSIRLIDGLVMRICDAIARKVAVTKWDDIKDDLQKGKKVKIPLVLEQNRFEFEPSLKNIKAGKEEEKGNKSPQDDRSQYKGQISAYSGERLGENDGEIDHIIPRSSEHGTLNDEANLMYISKADNQKKGNDEKHLNDLHSEYKKQIFVNKTDDEIIKFIYDKLVDEKHPVKDKNFKFGAYLSFINLNKDQQKAFRHALFLSKDDPLREKVIKSLNNRNRAIVNGTQRYLAQCIADKIYRMASKEDEKNQTHFSNKIEFDYFEYSARWDDPNSISNLRKKYAIEKPEKQPLYSHLIDAQLAFLIASEDHQNSGSMGIKFEANSPTIWENKIDKETGEILPSKLYGAIDVGEGDCKKVFLQPPSSNQKIIDIEKQNNQQKQNLSKVFKRSIFKQKAIGERYKPIVNFQDKWYLGYPRIKGGIYNCDEYCEKIKKKDITVIKDITDQEKYYQLTTNNEQIEIWTIKTIGKKYKQIDKDSHQYFSKLKPKYDEEAQKEVQQINFILSNCKYYVQKTPVINAPKVLSKKGAKKYPFYQNWFNFDNAWRKEVGDGYKKIKNKKEYDISDHKDLWDNFCKNWFSSPNKQTKNNHKAVKKYTMTSLGTASGTVFRINRNNHDIYQALPLDTKIIGKDKSNFLIKHSKNLALVSKQAYKTLNKKISLEIININQEINDYTKIFKKEFINDSEEQLKAVTAKLTNTEVKIKNFPLEEFKQWLNNKEVNKDDLNGKSINLLTESKINKEKGDSLYAHKKKVDDSILYPIRDGSIKDIKCEDQLVNFSLLCRKDALDKFLKKL